MRGDEIAQGVDPGLPDGGKLTASDGGMDGLPLRLGGVAFERRQAHVEGAGLQAGDDGLRGAHARGDRGLRQALGPSSVAPGGGRDDDSSVAAIAEDPARYRVAGRAMAS